MTTLYVVPAGTVCQVANASATPEFWRHHVTRVAVACSGLVSKTRRWYVLANGVWRIKVRKKYVLEEQVDDRKSEGAAAEAADGSQPVDELCRVVAEETGTAKESESRRQQSLSGGRECTAVAGEVGPGAEFPERPFAVGGEEVLPDEEGRGVRLEDSVCPFWLNEQMAQDCFWRGAALQTRKEPH